MSIHPKGKLSNFFIPFDVDEITGTKVLKEVIRY